MRRTRETEPKKPQNVLYVALLFGVAAVAVVGGREVQFTVRAFLIRLIYKVNMHVKKYYILPESIL